MVAAKTDQGIRSLVFNLLLLFMKPYFVCCLCCFRKWTKDEDQRLREAIDLLTKSDPSGSDGINGTSFPKWKDVADIVQTRDASTLHCRRLLVELFVFIAHSLTLSLRFSAYSLRVRGIK